MMKAEPATVARRDGDLAQRLPTFVIIGAMKCGTSSLHMYLARHPQVSVSAEKETEFFIEDRNWRKGLEWYASHFDPAARARGEASPNYTAATRFPGVPARMHAVIPEARLIYMVRDPAERVVSHWVHNYSTGRESRPLELAIAEPHYIERSMYWMQLSKYLEYFPAERIRVIDADDLRTRRAEVLREVFEFLDVDPEFYSRLYGFEKHRSSRKRRKTAFGMWLTTTRLARAIDALPPRARWMVRDLLYLPFSRRIERPALREQGRQRLIDVLGPDVERLRAFTGRDFASWCV